MAKSKGVQVSGTIRAELSEAIENHRWEVRKTRSELVTLAIEEYASNHNLSVEVPAGENSEAVSDQA
jgi:hypothetical protein